MKKYFQIHSHILLSIAFFALLTSCSSISTNTPTPSPTDTITPTDIPTPTSTPRSREFWGKPSYSPNGDWLASRFKLFEGNLIYMSFAVERLDGTKKWEIKKIPVENKPPYKNFPAPFMWSKDGETLYFVNDAFQDGCIYYPYLGEKLFSLNLKSGEIVTILDEFAYEIRFSPDESKIAYFGSGDTGLQILDLATGNTIEFEYLYPDTHANQYNLVWAPDNNQLVFTISFDTCTDERATSIVLVNISDNSQQVLIDEDDRRIYAKEWLDESTILATDWSENFWFINPSAGNIVSANK